MPYPIVWVVVVLVHGATDGWVPYGFPLPENGGTVARPARRRADLRGGPRGRDRVGAEPTPTEGRARPDRLALTARGRPGVPRYRRAMDRAPHPVPAVTADEWAELRERVRRTRWSPEWPVEGWEAGTDEVLLRRLARRWSEEFDWPAGERRMRELPWAQADLDGTPLAFLRFDAEVSGRLPIVLTNGWPSSVLELVALAERLCAPSRFGGDPADAATVIVPALPGFPFSPQRSRPGEQTHELWHRLMAEELGFSRYAAHGGDLGAGITSRLAESHPEAVAGIHLLAVSSPRQWDEASLSEEERVHLEEQRTWFQDEGAYEHQQQTRPLTLAPALSDSPVGLLAWILEKHRAWSELGQARVPASDPRADDVTDRSRQTSRQTSRWASLRTARDQFACGLRLRNRQLWD
nr:epoxide hydrolase [Rathayibacter rathayi]